MSGNLGGAHGNSIFQFVVKRLCDVPLGGSVSRALAAVIGSVDGSFWTEMNQHNIR